MPSGNQWRNSWSGCLLFSTIATISLAADAHRSKEIIAAGEQLFIKEFSVGQAGPSGGDGLGPLFNHVSCAACHRQGGLGGGGHIEFNVSLLSAQLEPGGKRPDDKLIRVTLKGLHPAFLAGDGKIVPNILLHRFGPGQAYSQLKA